MALADVVRKYGDAEIRQLAEAVREGEIPEETERGIRSQLAQADRDALATVVRDRPEFMELIDALDLERPPPAFGQPQDPPEILEGDAGERERRIREQEEEMIERVDEFTEAEQRAIDTVRSAIENILPTRDLEHIEAALEALQGGDPLPPNFSEEVVQNLPDAERQGFIETVEGIIADRAAQELDESDFPRVQDKLRDIAQRGPGYWQDVIEELETGEPIHNRLPEDALETLQRTDRIRERFLERARDNLRSAQGRIEGDDGGQAGGGGGRGGSPVEDAMTDAMDDATPDFMDVAEEAARDIVRGALGAGQGGSGQARRLVPDESRREDWRGNTYTTDPTVERALVRFQVQAEGDTGPLSQAYFKTHPERRQPTMRDHARYLVQNRDVSVAQAVEEGLPREWFEGIEDA